MGAARCLSDEILLVRSLLSAREADLVALLSEVPDALHMPIAAVILDGQPSIRKAVARVFPDVLHQLDQRAHLDRKVRFLIEVTAVGLDVFTQGWFRDAHHLANLLNRMLLILIELNSQRSFVRI